MINKYIFDCEMGENPENSERDFKEYCDNNRITVDFMENGRLLTIYEAYFDRKENRARYEDAKYLLTTKMMNFIETGIAPLINEKTQTKTRKK